MRPKKPQQVTSDIEELKKCFFSLYGVAFCLLLGSFFIDVFLFARNGSFTNNWGYSTVLICYYLAWLFTLSFGRGITVITLLFNFIIFCVLKEYYKLNVIPLKVYSVLELYKEGFSAGIKNYTSLFDTAFIVIALLTVLQIILVLRKSFVSLKKIFSFSVFFLVSGVLFFKFLFIPTEEVYEFSYPSLYLSYNQGMLYKVKWVAEFFTDKTAQEINKKIQAGNNSLIQKMKNDDVFLPQEIQHIYLIQVESLTTTPLKKENITPFLNREKLYYREDKNHHHCLGSANSDFMMMTGLNLNCSDTHTLVFYAYPTAIYNTIRSLAFDMKQKGYSTSFFHGYKGSFFNRRKHYQAMGFDFMYFEEDFPKQINRFLWGISDKDLLSFVAERVKEKSFTFIITAGMHPPYDISDKRKAPIKNPQTEEDFYMNSVNSFDKGLSILYDKAPQDSLFIVYGDHNVPTLDAMDTPLIIFYKGNKKLDFSQSKTQGFEGTVYFINSLLR